MPPPTRRARLRLQHGEFVARTIRPERVHGAVPARRRQHQQVARLSNARFTGSSGASRTMFRRARRRPGEDPLLVVVDEVERAGGVDRRPRDRVEAAFELLDCRAWRQHRRRDARGSAAGWPGSTSSTAKFALAHLPAPRHVLERVVVRELARRAGSCRSRSRRTRRSRARR